MLDLRSIRENLSRVQEGVAHKGVTPDWEAFTSLDTARRQLAGEVDGLKARRNQTSAEISKMKKKGEDVGAAIEATRTLGVEIKEKSEDLKKVDADLEHFCLRIPNLPHESVPVGKNAGDNQEVRRWGKAKPLEFSGKDHLELGEGLGLFDFKRGAKISGRGFPVYTGLGARLERALIRYFLETHVERNGFTEISPPLLVTRDTMTGTGQLPKMEEDMYRLEKDDLFLIPTAEVPVTNLHAGEWLQPGDLPLSYAAYTPCFRREAGAWGKDTRGFQRLHQFNKVEMVKFVLAENSYEVLEELVGYAEGLLQELGLAYRVVSLCSGDLSFAAAKCYDLEVYAPVSDTWLEVSSVSNFEDFQARRANIRVKVGGKPQFVHTLNGSGLATPRVLVALLETYQTREGSFKVPEVLQPYMGGLSSISPPA